MKIEPDTFFVFFLKELKNELDYIKKYKWGFFGGIALLLYYCFLELKPYDTKELVLIFFSLVALMVFILALTSYQICKKNYPKYLRQINRLNSRDNQD